MSPEVFGWEVFISRFRAGGSCGRDLKNSVEVITGNFNAAGK
jgi:hypothetical protein